MCDVFGKNIIKNCFERFYFIMLRDYSYKIFFLVFLASGLSVSAQWSVGLKSGWSNTTIIRYDGGRNDESYSPLGGFTATLDVRYALNSWLAFRSELGFMHRSHRMDRNLHYLDPVYTEHINNYLMLPLMADFSFGGQRLRGHLFTGAYAGFWISERRRGTTYWMTDYHVYFESFNQERQFTREDRRMNIGFASGVAISYSLNKKWNAEIDVLYYYDITSHHKGYSHLADPRYLNTITITVGFSRFIFSPSDEGGQKLSIAKSHH